MNITNKTNHTSNERFRGIFSRQGPNAERMRQKYPGTISQKSLTHSAVFRISTNLFNQKLHTLMLCLVGENGMEWNE